MAECHNDDGVEGAPSLHYTIPAEHALRCLLCVQSRRRIQVALVLVPRQVTASTPTSAALASAHPQHYQHHHQRHQQRQHNRVHCVQFIWCEFGGKQQPVRVCVCGDIYAHLRADFSHAYVHKVCKTPPFLSSWTDEVFGLGSIGLTHRRHAANTNHHKNTKTTKTTNPTKCNAICELDGIRNMLESHVSDNQCEI